MFVSKIPLPKLILSAAVLACVTSLAGWAEEGEFEEAEIFFELNHTDGDLGVHGLIDGDAWYRMSIYAEDGQEIFNGKVKRGLRMQGLTEIFFESDEPAFDDLDPLDFFARFPAGEYRIEGRTLDGEVLISETELTHVMPAPPAPSVNGEAMAMQCDEEEPGYDITEVSGPVTIAWPQVTLSHPDALGAGAGTQPPVPVTIVNYEVVVEVEVEVNGEEFTSVFSVILPPEVTSLTLPEEFLAQGDEFKYEVLAREESYNQTAVESCFALDE
ncbi:hypothetical protein QP938_03080 [Porticoccaceae bacterium LTM1]|nr:hypothetical protein QP938_03080 [Porticoccaceae bacterium LTM1]